jgi:multidrug efflux pump subunit AcrA (membrane-fusion protein)
VKDRRHSASEHLDDRITAEAEAKAKVAAAEAQLQQAQIGYRLYRKSAPFDGRAGRSPLSPGDVVSPGSERAGRRLCAMTRSASAFRSRGGNRCKVRREGGAESL